MRSLHRFFCLALPAAAAALSAGAGCGFPDVTFTGGDASSASAGGGAAGSTVSSASTGGASPDAVGAGGDGGAASSSAGAGGDGGATASGSGGEGGAASSSTGAGGDGGAASSSATASGSGGGGTVDCDVDRDGYRSTACEGGTDCNDENDKVHPGQPSTFYETPISLGGNFDYDCSGREEREFEAVQCSNVLPLCTAKTNVFQVDVPCGGRASFGNCSGTCQFTPIFPDYIRKCH
ncbi:hypothetical protein WME76_27100 [Sorangium sp. So ce119]|uniref:hypothetical protein n=1 Tax=Sorangium sp. So ce119 TaxID=3133279 RepID=UPI003F63EA80